MKIKKITKIPYKGKVYNISVKDNHNYFAEGILVGNCHEKSDTKGKHGNLDRALEVLSSLPAGVELAIGGGNPLAHPDLKSFLESLKNQGLVANMTVNAQHLKKFKSELTDFVKQDLIKGLGISYAGRMTKEIEYFCDLTDNAVIHVIAGVNHLDCLTEIKDVCKKVLVLGYKQFGKGKAFYSDEVDNKLYKWFIHLPRYFGELTLSFDNIAIEQLKLERFFPTEEWNKFYMGADGSHTMYLDCIEQEFAKSSTSDDRFGFQDDIRKMFKKIKVQE